MRYGALKKTDIANGSGVRVSLWVSGCDRHCPGCFNKESQSFDYGEEFTVSTMNEIGLALSKDFISGLTILGGEPLADQNRPTVLAIVYLIKKAFPDKTIWIYTGYSYEEVKEDPILCFTDVLVDGDFIEDLKDISLKFRGSSNQRIIDLKETKRSGSLQLWRDK